MYIVINKTLGTESNYTFFPYDILVELLENDNELIVISTYSNTIKVPYLEKDSNSYGKTKSNRDWAFNDFKIPNSLFNSPNK